MDTKIYDVLLQEFQERMAILSEAMARGNCTSFEEYRYTCGQLRGLEAACTIIIDLKQRMETIDD